VDSNISTIVEFLHGKGLDATQIAGVLGNMRVESGFSPIAYNSNEGAIGLCQWEGGRRTALQAFAARHGSTERDIHMQLGYLWQELQTSEHGAYESLLRARTPTEAATVWDAQFERSAGTTRQERINGAVHFADVLDHGGIPTAPDGGMPTDFGSTAPADGNSFDMPSGQSVAELQQRYEHQMEGWNKVLGVGMQSGSPVGNTVTPNEDALHTFLHNAVAQRGDPYVFGDKGPTAFDCSGLTQWAAEKAGIELPAGAAHQYVALKQAGMLIPVDKAMNIPGALLFHFAKEPQPGQGEPPVAHVAISLGHGKTIEAADTQLGVTELHSAGRFNYAAIIPGIGTDTPPPNHQVIEYGPGEAPPVHHHLTDADLMSLEGGHAHSLGHSLGHSMGSGGFEDVLGSDPGSAHDDGLGGSGWDFGHH
jgi:hypothetical protein